ncbi:hypothetical protein HK100_005358 [Physocladia obscura]|uniref:Lipid-binding serum glycoprotein N-terminal domain-containing protein n=1 Tax=Physocladia obscura TaxID=109957 RepID=A0AAD5XCC7_9FUNG|nr:hypothetical protein HK100_005358 [Physocladia obscura]
MAATTPATTPAATATPRITLKPENLRPHDHVPSITVTLAEHFFDKVSNLVKPIAHNAVLELTIGDQHVKKHLPVIGDHTVATASNIKVTKFDMDVCRFVPRDAFLRLELDDIDLRADMDVKVLSGPHHRVAVESLVDIGANVKLAIVDQKIKTTVFDTKVQLKDFEPKIDSGINGEILSHITELLEKFLKTTIESTLDTTVSESLASAVDSVLNRDWDIKGSVSRVFYNCAVEFLGEIGISETHGVKIDIGVDVTHRIKNAQTDQVSEDLRE